MSLGYIVGAQFEDDVDVLVVFEVVFELHDVMVLHALVDEYLRLQFFFGLSLRQAVLVDHFRCVVPARLLRNKLDTLCKSSLDSGIRTFPSGLPLM